MQRPFFSFASSSVPVGGTFPGWVKSRSILKQASSRQTATNVPLPPPAQRISTTRHKSEKRRHVAALITLAASLIVATPETHANVEFPGSNLLDGLANYLPVWAAERKTNIVVDQSNLSIRGQTRRTIEFWLDNSLIAAALRITYPGTGRNLAFKMQSPDGTPTQFSISCKESGVVQCVAVVDAQTIEIRGHGRYTFVAKNTGERPVDITLTVLAVTKSPTEKLHIDVAADGTITYPQPGTIRAIAFGPTSRVRGATLTATATDPTGARYELDLHPSRHDPDSWTIDVPYFMNGSHVVQIRADATGPAVEFSHETIAGGSTSWTGYSPADEQRFTRVRIVDLFVENFQDDDHHDDIRGSQCTSIDHHGQIAHGRVDTPADIDCFKLEKAKTGHLWWVQLHYPNASFRPKSILIDAYDSTRHTRLNADHTYKELSYWSETVVVAPGHRDTDGPVVAVRGPADGRPDPADLVRRGLSYSLRFVQYPN